MTTCNPPVAVTLLFWLCYFLPLSLSACAPQGPKPWPRCALALPLGAFDRFVFSCLVFSHFLCANWYNLCRWHASTRGKRGAQPLRPCQPGETDQDVRPRRRNAHSRVLPQRPARHLCSTLGTPCGGLGLRSHLLQGIEVLAFPRLGCCVDEPNC